MRRQANFGVKIGRNKDEQRYFEVKNKKKHEKCDFF